MPADRLRAEHSGHIWALDFQFDQTADGRVLKLLHVVDEVTREALEMLVYRRIDADTTVAVIERLAHERGAPEHVRCDNGPELTGHALRDWCRFTTTQTAFIEPGSPWQNPYVESFGARVRDGQVQAARHACKAEGGEAGQPLVTVARAPQQALGQGKPGAPQVAGRCAAGARSVCASAGAGRACGRSEGVVSVAAAATPAS